MTEMKEAETFDLQELINSQNAQAQFAAALPKVGIDAKQFARMAITTLNLNPALYKCDPLSIMRCLVLSAQYGLPPTGRGGMWLVPYGKVCTPIIDWRGLMEMARRSGVVTRMMANCVHTGDAFDYEEGSDPFLKHKRTVASSETDKDVTHVYCIAHLKDGPPIFKVFTRMQVEGFRARSKASRSGPWVTDWQAMAMKTVVRRLCEFLPMQSSDQRLLEIVSHEEAGLDVSAMMPTVSIDAEVATTAPESDAPVAPEGGYTDKPFE